MFGKNRAIDGKIVSMIRQTIIEIQKGNMPRNMVYRGTFFAMPLTIKTLMPMGGVIMAISRRITSITPNQIGSNPSSRMIGKITGIVSTRIANPSRKQPRMA